MSEDTINNDELAVFVESTLNAIAKGVESASSKTKSFSVPSRVTFEVAVTATRGSEGRGGLKLQVFNVEGKRSSSDEQISRVSFEVSTATKSSGGSIDYGDWKTA